MLSGTVRNKETGEPIENALILVNCTCLQKEVQAYSNANGLYVVRDLPAGYYSVGIYAGQGGEKFEVQLARGQKTRRSVRLTNSIVREIDVGPGVKRDAVAGIGKIKADELTKLPGAPGGDAFSGALGVDPRGSSDAGGDATIGHSSAEMDYRVDGVSINDPALNRPMFKPVAEFFDTVEVKGSGYEAEYGGYLGGVVEGRRISGSNVTRGRARFSFTPRLAQPRFTIRTDDAIRAREVFDYQMQGVLSVSGPLIKDKLFWSAGIMVLGTKSTLIQTYHAREDADGSGGYEDCPHRNGDNDCAADANFITTKKFAEQTFPTQGINAQATGGLQWQINPKHRIEIGGFASPSFLRRSYRRPVNLNNLDPDFLGASPNADPVTGGSTVANGVVNGAFGWDRINAFQTSLAYKGRVAKDKIEIDAGLAFSQSKIVEAWRLDDPSLKQQVATQSFDAQGRNLFEMLDDEGRLDLAPRVEDACNREDLPGLTCPVRSWMSGGIGQFQQSRSRRIGGNLALTHFFNAQGSHQLKYGTQIEHTERKRRLQYSGNNDADFFTGCGPGETDGGEYCYSPGGGYSIDNATRVDNHRLVLVDLDNPNQRRSLGYGRVRSEEGSLRAIATPLGAGVRAPYYEGTVSSQNYGVFLQDKWSILSNLTLGAGVRWDIQDMRDVLGRRSIFVWDNVAPRASLVYDWTDKGESRLYASYGWFYQTLPLALLNRVYGGQINVVRNYRDNDCQNALEIQDPETGQFVEHHRKVDGQPTEYCTDTDEFTTGLTEGTTVPRLRGQYEQQWTLGYDHEVVEDLILGISWLHNDLGRAVEDVSTDGGQNFIVANPGIPVSGDDIANQNATCDRLDAQLDGLGQDDPARTQLARELQRCRFLSDAYERVGEMFTKPRRTSDAFTFMVNKRFAKNWRLIGSYTFSRMIGNYDGFVDPVTGAVNLGSAIQYDTPELVRNSFGDLSYSSPHRFKLDGFYTFNLDKAGALVLGASLRVASGYPVSMRVGSNRHPGQFPIYLLPRGAGGRLDPNYQVNLAVQYAYPIMAKRKGKDGKVPEDARAMMLGVGARLYNVTNAKATLRVDEVYSFQNSRPIAGGDLGDLKHAKTQSQANPTEFFSREIVAPQGNYGVEAAFQMPLAAQFDVNLMF